jgi:hypothetical protein
MSEAIPRAEAVQLAGPSWVRSGAPGTPSLALAGAGALSFLAAASLRLDAPGLLLFACPFRAATGLPCLGCGATHAFVHLAHGRLLLAIAANPLWALVAASWWAFSLFTVARRAGLSWTLAWPALSPRSLRRLRFLLGALAFANWAFVALPR